MANIHPNAATLIDEYIENNQSFSKEICSLLRTLVHKSSKHVVEDWKWRMPVFHKNVMVCGFTGFKKHVSLTFFHGVRMSDPHHLFRDDCSAQNTRIIKFHAISEINEHQLIDYFKEAFSLSESGVKKIIGSTKIEIPVLLQKALDKNKPAKENFDAMS